MQFNYDNCELIDSYEVLYSKVNIYNCNEFGVYHLEEPITKEGTIEEFIKRLSTEFNDQEVIKKATEIYGQRAQEIILSLKREMGYGKLHILLNDDYIEDISVVGLGNVWVRHKKHSHWNWLISNVIFNKKEEINYYIEYLAQKAGESITKAKPMRDFSLPEGHRVFAVREEISPTLGFTIRRKSEKLTFTLNDLIEIGSLSLDELEILKKTLEAKGSIMIIGPPSSGKTTLVSAIANELLPKDSKVVVIEDTREIPVPQNKNWRILRTIVIPYLDSKTDINMEDLVKASLRDSPDYIVVGEVRGRETKILVQAFNLGIGGITTFHADDEDAALRRLRSPPIKLEDSQISSINIIVTLSKIKRKNKTERFIKRISYLELGKKVRPKPLFFRDNGNLVKVSENISYYLNRIELRNQYVL